MNHSVVLTERAYELNAPNSKRKFKFGLKKKNNLVLQTNFNGKENTNGENSLSWSI